MLCLIRASAQVFCAKFEVVSISRWYNGNLNEACGGLESPPIRHLFAENAAPHSNGSNGEADLQQISIAE